MMGGKVHTPRCPLRCGGHRRRRSSRPRRCHAGDGDDDAFHDSAYARVASPLHHSAKDPSHQEEAR